MSFDKWQQEISYHREVKEHCTKLRGWIDWIEQDQDSKIENYQDKIYSLDNRHFYVYMVVVDNRPVYVGKGCNKRWEHSISGTSSVKELNRDYFNGKHIEVFLLAKRLHEGVALDMESYYAHLLTSLGCCLYNDMRKLNAGFDEFSDYEDFFKDQNISKLMLGRKVGSVNEPCKGDLIDLYLTRELDASEY